MEEEFTEATLMYVIDDEDVLLIKEKRGHGEGNLNGPGGKVEDHDNTIKQAAIRETVEETKVKPLNPEKVAEIEFTFGENPFQRVHVFKTREYQGEPEETEEAKPSWYKIGEIPYDKMWPDDKYWMPKMFDGKSFKAEFFFDSEGEKIKDFEIKNQEFKA